MGRRHRDKINVGDDEQGDATCSADAAVTEHEKVKKEKKKKRKKDKKKHKKEKKRHRKESESSSIAVSVAAADVDKSKKRSADDAAASLDETEKKKRKKKRRMRSSSSGGGGDDGVPAAVCNDIEGKQGGGASKAERSTGDKKEADVSPDLNGPGIASSALDYLPGHKPGEVHDQDRGLVTLLLFYQYVEPPWDAATFHAAMSHVQSSGEKHGITGRARVAREGLNCTLTGSYHGIRAWCRDLRNFGSNGEFEKTEFKLTDHLPRGQMFPKLHAFEVTEIVNYGLAGKRAPPIAKTGVHLEPEKYHQKIAEGNTVIIDVRNHYEANIGRFQPPETGAKYVDPNMRKSTEFPVWLDKPETKEMLRGKQVLMYCTGGVRCERASALLRHKIETEDDVKDLGIKGVYQLQGGIDKYFKKFPDGGHWAGKNFVFDKRFAHAPPAVEGMERAAKAGADETGGSGGSKLKARKMSEDIPAVMGSCEACGKPWDMYRGKRRCPTCGVPSLICRDCFDADANGVRKLGKEVRCDLCMRENITSKKQIKEKEKKEMVEYERKLRQKDKELGVTTSGEKVKAKFDSKNGKEKRIAAPNPDGTTRLLLKNMCSRRMDEATLVDFMPGITHIQWLKDRKTGRFFGSAFVEMKDEFAAAMAVGMDGEVVLGRPIKVRYQRADPKDVWPLQNTAVR